MTKERRRRSKTIPTPRQVARGIYIDFEGFKEADAAFLGVIHVNEGGGEEFVQYVFDPVLHAAARRGGPACGGATEVADFDRVIAGIADLAEREDRWIFAWSSRELTEIARRCRSAASVAVVRARHRDAKLAAKPWLKRHHPGLRPPKDRRGGRPHTLHFYEGVVGYHVPPGLGPGLTGKRLRDVRGQLVRHRGDFSKLTRVAKAKWTKLLRHNQHDCRGMFEVLRRVSAQASAVSTGR